MKKLEDMSGTEKLAYWKHRLDRLLAMHWAAQKLFGQPSILRSWRDRKWRRAQFFERHEIPLSFIERKGGVAIMRHIKHQRSFGRGTVTIKKKRKAGR